MVRKGDLNYSITLITRNLLILHSAQGPNAPQSASIVRLLYGERAAEEKAAEVFFSSILPRTV
jgi:hypothetical protein